MLNKIISLSIITAIASAMLFNGCKLTSSQMENVAMNAGVVAAVTWMAYDNPSTEAKSQVISIMNIIEEKAHEVEANTSYTEILYPHIQEFIMSSPIENQQKIVVLAGSLAILKGIDMLFALYPACHEQHNMAVQTVYAFINGARYGLSMNNKELVVIQAKDMHNIRSKIFDK